MRGAEHHSNALARIVIVGIFVAGGLSVSTPARAQLFDVGQRQHVIDCLFWLLTDPALQAANCQARPTTTETGGAGGARPAGSDPARSAAGTGNANTGSYSGPGSNSGGFNSAGDNVGFGQFAGSNTGFFSDGDQNTGFYNPPGQNTGTFNEGNQNTGSYN